ncbi:MAG: hypothetical protein ACKVWV_15630 [Planctomycetota bacterium]
MPLALLASLAVLGTSNPARAQSPIAFGQGRLGTTACHASSRYSFAANVGDYVVAHVVEIRDHGGVCCSACFCYELCLTLTDPNGLPVTSNCAPPSGNNPNHRQRTKIGPLPLPSSGTFELVVADHDNCGRGEFLVFLQRTSEPGLAIDLLDADSLLGVVNAPGETTTYRFAGTGGDRVTIDMATQIGGVVPQLEVFDPLGRLFAAPGNGAVDSTLPLAGQYTVLAYSNVEETGTYRLDFNRSPASAHNYCRTSPNSAGAGARILFAGSTSVAANDLSLLVRGCPQASSGFFFLGRNAVQQPIGDGLLCIGGPVLRFGPLVSSSMGAAVLALDNADTTSSAHVITPGSSWRFQYFYRDPALPGGAGFNFSDGLLVLFGV